jgi:hypothetical protein
MPLGTTIPAESLVAPAVSESTSENLSSVTGEAEELFPGTITYNCPQEMTKYYSKGVPYQKETEQLQHTTNLRTIALFFRFWDRVLSECLQCIY